MAAAGGSVDERLADFRCSHDGASTFDLIAAFLSEFQGSVAAVSSFGAEAAVTLHMIAQIEPLTPVLFINTGKMFGETLRYRDLLQTRLGLRDVRTIAPSQPDLRGHDPQGVLHSANPDECCAIRKVWPLQACLAPFDAWISGRKRFQSESRSQIERIEYADGKFKLNPLAEWSKSRLTEYFASHDLPLHPLERQGFYSIGCMPCTDRVGPGEDVRMGRWRGSAKQECGIHNMSQVPLRQGGARRR